MCFEWERRSVTILLSSIYFNYKFSTYRFEQSLQGQREEHLTYFYKQERSHRSLVCLFLCLCLCLFFFFKAMQKQLHRCFVILILESVFFIFNVILTHFQTHYIYSKDLSCHVLSVSTAVMSVFLMSELRFWQRECMRFSSPRIIDDCKHACMMAKLWI